jgi:hypothetical protein
MIILQETVCAAAAQALLHTVQGIYATLQGAAMGRQYAPQPVVPNPSASVDLQPPKLLNVQDTAAADWTARSVPDVAVSDGVVGAMASEGAGLGREVRQLAPVVPDLAADISVQKPKFLRVDDPSAEL